MDKRKFAKEAAYFGIILILVLVMLFSGLRILESTVFLKHRGAGSAYQSKTITRNGVDYYPRQDITVIMVLGVDESGPVKDSGSYNNSGACDMVALLIFDEAEKSCRALCFNRDTMVEMPVLGIGGRRAGTYYGQLALSHTYGSGLEDSCENTRQTVSNLLYGITIDYYVSVNMDAIAILNDSVGGVTVTVEDDFSQVDPTLVKGEVTLLGEQALNFVRTRKGVGDQLNVSRMDRQQAYIHSFTQAFREKAKSAEYILSLSENIAPYMVTDCSANALSGMLQRYADYELLEILSPRGENAVGKKYYEFHLDEAALDALILRLFYAPKG